MLRGGDAFDGKEIIKGEAAAGFARAIGDDGMVEKCFDGGGEI